jgi:hypothetical protein
VAEVCQAGREHDKYEEAGLPASDREISEAAGPSTRPGLNPGPAGCVGPRVHPLNGLLCPTGGAQLRPSFASDPTCKPASSRPAGGPTRTAPERERSASR